MKAAVLEISLQFVRKMLTILLLVIVSTLFALFYAKRIHGLNYWKERGFPTLEKKPHWFLGNFSRGILGKRSLAEEFKDAHDEFKRNGHKVGGAYLLQLPILFVTDNEIMKRMLQTDFDAFADRGVIVDPVNNPLSINLFSLDGKPWQKIRRKLSPTFTSGKIKMMFPLIEQHVDILIKVLRNMSKSGEDIALQKWLDKAGVDIIAHVAFGLDCNTLENRNQYFFEMAQRITRPHVLKVLKLLLFNFKNPADLLLLLSSDKTMSNFFINLVKNTVHHRRSNNIKTIDFLQLLIEMIEEEEKEAGSGLNMMEIAAQAFAFFVAGFETSSRTIIFALYALAKDLKQQRLLRESIQKEIAASKGVFDYDWIMNNERLDMVMKETLRIYSPVITLNRQATKDYEIFEEGLTVPKGTCVVFSTFGFHHDPEHFEDPLEFKPERFSKENKKHIKPFTNIPFGEGPRFCIGKRFGYLQSKIILAKILYNFEVAPGALTEYPFKISPLTGSLLLTIDKSIYLNLRPL